MENDGVSDKLSKILSDPESLKRLQSAANELFSGRGEEKEDSAPALPDEAAAVMKALSVLKNSEPDDRSRLLYALRPYLGERRRERVDRAIKLLRLSSIMPLLGDIDIFKI